MSGTRVLIVDEEASTIRTLVGELEQQGFEALGVTDGAEAIRLYEAQPFGLVLVGVATMGMKGIEVVRTLMRYDPEALVVMMGADPTVETAVEALKSGAREFIDRPLDIPELIAKVRGVLELGTEKAVRGNLRDLALTGIISVNCSEHNQAELILRREGHVGAIYFDQGTIVHASLDDEEGEAAIYELLSWEDGSFSLRQGTPPPRRTVHSDWTGLLLEGMRRMDEVGEDLDLEWDDDAIGDEAGVGRVARALEALEGIESVVICSPGGELLAGTSGADPARAASLAALGGQRALGIALALSAGQPTHIFITGALGRLMVVPYGEDLVGLWLSGRETPESVMLGVTTVLRRYRRLKGEQL